MSRALCVRKTLWERQLSPSSAAGPQLYSQEYKHVPRPSKQPLIEEAAIQGTEAARRDLFVGLPFSQPVATSLLRGHSHPRGPGKHLQGCWGLTKGGMWERWRWLQRAKGRRAKGLWRDTQVLGCSECQTLLGFLFCFFFFCTPQSCCLPPDSSRVLCQTQLSMDCAWARIGGSVLPLPMQKAPALHLLPWEAVTGREVPQLQLGTVSTEIYYQRLPMPCHLLQSSLLLAWSLIKGLTLWNRIFPNSIIYRKEQLQAQDWNH